MQNIRNREGSALLLSLWALLVLSMAVFAWIKFIRVEMETAYQADAGLDALALAHSGAEVGLHLQHDPHYAVGRNLQPTRSYDVTIVGEGGKLNLNWVLQGENPDRLSILKQYLALKGLNFQQTAVLVDSLLDWVDADSVKRPNGMEDGPNYHPPNRPMRSLDELTQVNGAGPLVSQKGWQNELTIYSTGRVDLLAAPLIILESLPGVNQASAERFVQLRQGPDKKDGTQDDYVFPKDLNSILSYLGVSGQFAANLRRLVTFNDNVFYITSTGHSGNLTRQTTVIARKGNNNPNILLWKDL
ncbi:MAG: type II secretion system protein GspK [Chthoniobacteraceae bacterium]